MARRELVLLKKAIETNFPGVDLDELAGRSAQRPQQPTSPSDDQRRSLASLRNKLQDNEQLRHFGLATDGRRIKAIHTGGHLMSKDEYEALIRLLDHAVVG